MKTNGPLHNNASIALKDATNTQIAASIAWYESTLAKYPLTYMAKHIAAPARWTDSLAVLKAERANRVGKK